MFGFTVPICVIGFAVWAAPVSACRVYIPSADVSVIWQQLPSHLPSDAFVAEVKLEHPNADWTELFKGIQAHVQKVIQGDYSGRDIIVRDKVGPGQIRITCYAPVRFGGSGFLIGKPIGYESGVLVVQPIFQPAKPGKEKLTAN